MMNEKDSVGCLWSGYTFNRAIWNRSQLSLSFPPLREIHLFNRPLIKSPTVKTGRIRNVAASA